MISFRLFLRFAALLFAGAAPIAAQTGFPFQDESLRYSINWPSGLSLGDASFSARHTASGWNFEASLSAAVPGFAIADKYQSSVTPELCSLSLDRTISHGSKKTQEKTTFDQQKGSAHRVTLVPKDGGQSDMDIPSCAHDALAFVYFTRREMGQGRMPSAQKVYLGSAYSIRTEYTGPMNIPVGGKSTVTDHVIAYCHGPKSDFNFEIYFARDAARTPLLIRVPLSMGTFSMELVR